MKYNYFKNLLGAIFFLSFLIPNHTNAQNNALNFDHTGAPNRDFVSIPYNNNLDINTSQLTLSAWVKPNGASFFDNILIKGNYGYGFTVDNNNQLGYWSNSLYSNCPRFGTITDNVWTHVAVVVVQGSSTTFYINGVQVGQSTTAGHTTINLGGATPLTLGRQGDFDGNYFGGDMDEVMVWNTALNATQINTAMSMGFAGSESGLVAYYKFNQGVANANNAGVTTLTDTAGGDNNGTLTNFTLSTGAISNWVSVEFPEINLQGNGTTIADGDVTPSSADHTDFVATGISTPLVRTFTIQNTGTGTLNIASISNTNPTDFTVGGLTLPTTVTAGSSKTFTVTLNSATMGTKNATITINSNDADEASYDFAITGRIINATPSAVRGNMMNFDGINDLINAGDINALDGVSRFTYETWLYIPSGTWSNFGMIMSKQEQPATGFRRIELALSGGSQGGDNDLLVIVADASSNANYNTTTNVIQYNTWYHVAMVFDGTLSLDTDKLKLYVNGIQQTMTPFDATPVPALTDNNAGSLCIGARQNASIPFRGSLDEARIWNTARTQDQIRENMHLTLLGAETGLVAYYQFNETSGNAIDAVSGNNGTLQGGAVRATSDVAVARGASSRQTINSTGLKTFTATNLAINFTTVSGSDEFVAYQLRGTPHNGLLTGSSTSCYWLVRQFGSSGIAYNGMNFTIPATNIISSTDETTPSNLKLYKRGDVQTTTFGTSIASGTSASNATKIIQFTGFASQTSFSQFIIGSSTSPLPITLLSFEGKRQDENNVLLNWKTATETNNKGFEVETSANGIDFDKIAFVDGAGNNSGIKNYELGIRNEKDAYFRLKQVDFNGEFAYSNVVFLPAFGNEISIFPNPAQDFIIISSNKENSIFEITDLKGISLQKGTLKETKTTISTKNFNKGVYLVSVLENGKRTVKKIVLE